MMTEQFAVPNVLHITKFSRIGAQIFLNRLFKVINYSRRTSNTRLIIQSCKTFLFKIFYPVFNSSRTVTQYISHFIACKSFAYKKYPVKPMIITRFFTFLNLLLERKLRDLSIFNFKFSHR